MRPVKRGKNPINKDFPNSKNGHQKAKPDLISRMGHYCSYCERRIPLYLSVEHIQPQSLYSNLKRRWTNFLLACWNCNRDKSDTDVVLSKVLLPDRDNTFAAFIYTPDGNIKPSQLAIDKGLNQLAHDTLTLTGLDKKISEVVDKNGKEIAIDRVKQREEAWLLAQRAKGHITKQPDNDILKEQVIDTAKENGFFSIWMTVFENDSDMRNRLIDAFAGTRESGCFDVNGNIVTPAPNPDQLANGSKI
jgi:uncharacterized protein (TIGR02646 family)